MKVEFRKSFTKDLRGVSDKNILKRVKDAIEAVEKADVITEIPNRKKLKGDGNYFRVRIGDYRLGFALENETIIFVRFLHRKEIYKFFP